MKDLKNVILMLFCFSSGFIMAQEGLIHQYKFDGDLKDAVGDAHGTIIKGGGDTPVFVKGRDGTENGAISFPLRDKGWYIVDVGTWSPSQEGTPNEMTVTFWAYWRGSTGTANDIINKRDGWGADKVMWGIVQHDFTGKVLSVHRPGDKAKDGKDRIYADSKKGLTPDKWTHVAVSMDNVKAYFYMDGERYDEQPYTFGYNPDLPIRIGNSVTKGPNIKDIYNGALDDVRFYSRVLTDQEIKDVFSDKGTNGDADPTNISLKSEKVILSGLNGLNMISLRLIPNLACPSFQINGLTGSAMVSVVDINGKLLVKKEVRSNQVIASEALAQGLYIVKIVSTEGIAALKLLIN